MLPIASGRAYLIKPTAWSATIGPFTQVALKANFTFEPVKHSRMLLTGGGPMPRHNSFFALLIVALLSTLVIGCGGGGKNELIFSLSVTLRGES
jgi:hypothetical protein